MLGYESDEVNQILDYILYQKPGPANHLDMGNENLPFESNQG